MYFTLRWYKLLVLFNSCSLIGLEGGSEVVPGIAIFSFRVRNSLEEDLKEEEEVDEDEEVLVLLLSSW